MSVSLSMDVNIFWRVSFPIFPLFGIARFPYLPIFPSMGSLSGACEKNYFAPSEKKTRAISLLFKTDRYLSVSLFLQGCVSRWSWWP